jgi:hypothetical protein
MSKEKNINSSLLGAAIQGRARDRALAELLIEKGILTEEEYLNRADKILQENHIGFIEDITGLPPEEIKKLLNTNEVKVNEEEKK